MTRTDLIKNLEYTKSKYKDKFVGTGEINIYEMVSDVLRYLNQPTTEINIDYYNELKTKVDKWDDKETPYKPTGVEPFGLTKMGFCKCGKAVVENENYCVHCGNKLDWESEGSNE